MNSLSVDEQVRLLLERAQGGHLGYEAALHFPGSAADRTEQVVFGFAIHGNEHGSLPAALALSERFAATPPPVDVTLLLGNVEAILKNERFLDEDFNRVFTFDRPAQSRERARAERVRPVLDRATLFIDFHQTQTPTAAPFFTFPWDRELAAWARIVGVASYGLTRSPGVAFSPGLKCLDEYVRDRGYPGITLETGYRGQDITQATAIVDGVERILTALSSGKRPRGAELQALAARSPEINWYQTTHILRAHGPADRLRPGLENWTPLEAGSELQEPGAPLLLCPANGVALFPKYVPVGQTPPPELVRIAVPLADPTTLEL